MTAMDPDDPFPHMSEEIIHGIDQYIEAQTAFIETWVESIEASTDDEVLTSGARGIAEAYEVWLAASREWTDHLTAVTEGEEFDPRAVRDVWLRAANESSQAIMGTDAFARLTGQRVEEALEIQRQRDETVQAMLEGMGVATSHSVEEVGERLVELERRHHDVAQKLDRILERLEGP